MSLKASNQVVFLDQQIHYSDPINGILGFLAVTFIDYHFFHSKVFQVAFYIIWD